MFNVINNIFVGLFIYFDFIQIEIFYIDHVIKKVDLPKFVIILIDIFYCNSSSKY